MQKPIDVLNYYPLVDENGDFSEFAEVESLAPTITDDNEKFATNKLKIGAKLSFADFIKLSFSFDFKNIEENSKYPAKIGSSGDFAQISLVGNSAKIGSSGDLARIGSSGNFSVIMCAGEGSRAKAKKGSWITLTEWRTDMKKGKIPVCVKTEYVDGKNIKEYTFYVLKDGKFKEV